VADLLKWDYSDNAVEGDVTRALREALAVEGPVHRDRLIKAVASAFDLSQVREARAANIADCIPAQWYAADDEGRSSTCRLHEVANAMVALCRASGASRRRSCCVRRWRSSGGGG
jgi:hypothetical protein